MVQMVHHRIRMNLLVGCPWRNGWSPQSVSGVQKGGALQQNLGQLKPLKSWHSIVTRNQVIHTTFDLKYGLFFCPATLLSQLWFVDFTPISGESTPVFVFDGEAKPNTPNCFIQDLSDLQQTLLYWRNIWFIEFSLLAIYPKLNYHQINKGKCALSCTVRGHGKSWKSIPQFIYANLI